MAQDIITRPVSTVIETATDSAVVERLNSSYRLLVRVRWDKDEDDKPYMAMVVSPGHGADIGAALAYVETQMAPATAEKMGEALTVISRVCLRPSDFDDADVVIWTRRMLGAFSDYPADVVLQAFDEWPASARGKFWPLENDIHVMCQAKSEFRARLRRELEAMARRAEKPLPDGSAVAPIGQTETFKNAVRAKMGENYVTSWLSEKTCAFGENVVLTTRLGSERLSRDVGDIATKLGVRIVYDPTVSERFHAG